MGRAGDLLWDTYILGTASEKNGGANMYLTTESSSARFTNVPLEFTGTCLANVFAAKNNKTLRETLAHRRYAKLHDECVRQFPKRMDMPLGEFLIDLKENGDEFYRRFLNAYGDLEYCAFKITDTELLDSRGVYAYMLDGELRYVGRCKDSMKKRVNQGYGRISPKNCYIDGQATNCHLNALICQVQHKVSLWLHAMVEAAQIEELERELLIAHRPSWNIQLR